MKTLPALSHIGNVATLSALLLIAPGVIAQSDPGATNLLTPVVSVLAADPQTSEAGPDKGAFLIRRAGSTNTALRVFYQITGTATPGSDYEPLDLSVLLPA